MNQQPIQPCKEKEEAAPKYPIINCHTHIFTGDHVAPLLAKSIVMAPFYRLVNFKWVFAIFRWWYNTGPGKTKFGGEANTKAVNKYKRMMFIRRTFIVNIVVTIVGVFLTLHAADVLCHWIFPDSAKATGWLMRQLHKAHSFLYRIHVLYEIRSIWLKLLVIVLVVVFFRSGRNFLLFILKSTVSILGKLPGKQTKELFQRYLTIGRFAFHKTQGSTLGQLQGQYPDDSGFVILPMDMEYMDAGKLSTSYKDQMAELAKLKSKNHIYPFVFVDPRRIAEEGKGYFDYEVVNGQVVLNECFIKEYIERKEFSGFKIYPALGYYPFDPLLLPLWKYAEQKQIPILTHCVRGPMYYRGSKKKEWDFHPIFEEVRGEASAKVVPQPGTDVCDDCNKPDNYKPLLLPQTNNSEYSANFTHPMNFICLLKKQFFAKAVAIAHNKADDTTKKKLVALFGYAPGEGKRSPAVQHGLDDLKICLGHYGGGDEWLRYFEKDRAQHSAQLAMHPDRGIDFLRKADKPLECAFGKPEQLWKHTDWYSIISSMMLQHNNVYADISYILHADAEILPLLKQTLQNPGLRPKVLYGTDFYVVRNHKSDRNMLADMMGGLEVEDFDVIARCNPRKFLNLSMGVPVTTVTPEPEEGLE